MPNINEPLEWNDSLKLEFFEVIYRVSGAEEVSDVFDKFIKYKQRKPLFTTEDGVDIFEGDNWWIVGSKDDKWKIDQIQPKLGHIMNPNYEGLRFSTEEKANEYILMNKPLLSVNDAINCAKSGGFVEMKFIEIAKSKLNG